MAALHVRHATTGRGCRAVGAKKEARDLYGNRPGRCVTGKVVLLCMRWYALVWGLAEGPRRVWTMHCGKGYMYTRHGCPCLARGGDSSGW